jgi:hypothetical protein
MVSPTPGQRRTDRSTNHEMKRLGDEKGAEGNTVGIRRAGRRADRSAPTEAKASRQGRRGVGCSQLILPRSRPVSNEFPPRLRRITILTQPGPRPYPPIGITFASELRPIDTFPPLGAHFARRGVRFRSTPGYARWLGLRRKPEFRRRLNRDAFR